MTPPPVSTLKSSSQHSDHEDRRTHTPTVGETVGGFTAFLRQNGIAALAVGFVVGTQVQTVVKQIISSFIDPLSSLLIGGRTLSSRTFTLHFNHHYANFGWGGLVYVLIDFLFVLLVVYVLVKVFKLDRFDTPKA